MASTTGTMSDTWVEPQGSGIPAPAATRYYTIENDHYRAVISTLGAGLQALTFDGRALVETYPQGEVAPLTAGLVLAPWPNRLDEGTFTVDGTEYRMPLNEQDRSNALHGLVFDRQWHLQEHTSQSVTLGIEIGPENHWPWSTEVTATYELGEDGLHARFVAQAKDEKVAPTGAIPFVFGWHTYLQAQGAPTDSCTLRVDVDTQLDLDPQRKLPVGTAHESTLAQELAQGLPLRGHSLDDCFHSSADGFVTTTFTDESGRGVEMTCSSELSWYQIFTPGEDIEIPYPGAPRGRAVAVEPMTGPPNALTSGIDVHDLARGPQRLSVRMTAINP